MSAITISPASEAPEGRKVYRNGDSLHIKSPGGATGSSNSIIQKIAMSPLFQAGSQLDFVHLSGITDGVNQALKKIRGDFNHLVFLVDL